MELSEQKTRIGEYLWHWAEVTLHAEAAVRAGTRLNYLELAGHAVVQKISKAFEIMDDLPRLAIGKIDKQGLQSRLRTQQSA